MENVSDNKNLEGRREDLTYMLYDICCMISVGKLEPLALLGGMQNYATAMATGIALPQNNKNRIIM